MSKTTYIVVAVVIIVVAVIAGAYILMNYGGGGGGGGGGNTYVPSNATTLQFNVDETLSGVTSTYNVFANNTVSSQTKLRIEIAGSPLLVYILDEGQQKVWGNATGSWIQEDYSAQWAYWSPKYEAWVNNLANWTTGEKTYTATDGTAVRIYNIQVNPTLAASLFEAPVATA